MAFECSREVVNDYEKLFESDEEYDVIIYVEYLIKHQHEFLQQNPTEILETVYQNGTFTDLWNSFLKRIYLINNILTIHMVPNKKPNLDMQPDKQNGANVVAVKNKNSKQIVGGYNPLFWESDNNGHFKSTNDSFIFSFTNRDNLQTAKVGYNNYQNSICCFLNNGPVFGRFK
ncbi:hypothetical protein C1645_835524 [Glomus cerebriforme]|uniref:TLDc domain-containing protein n=1 Tax=Glomus cerebriforme TaxID=658196 RepID=A0A397SBU8_9GLOM|nr:hypothetical protein C1645_835524 [Glomus cerebriforme]